MAVQVAGCVISARMPLKQLYGGLKAIKRRFLLGESSFGFNGIELVNKQLQLTKSSGNRIYIHNFLT